MTVNTIEMYKDDLGRLYLDDGDGAAIRAILVAWNIVLAVLALLGGLWLLLDSL